MESWGSVVPELTFLNKPWDDLLLRPHSSRAFMPERLPLPLDIESLNKKHIFYDRAMFHASLTGQPDTPSPVSRWHAILTAHLLQHTHERLSHPLTPFCRLWYHRPVRSWKWRDSAAARDTPCANFHVIALHGVQEQRWYTELLPDFWGHAEGLRCAVSGIQCTSCCLWPEL